MDGIRQYLISITAAAIICGVVKSLFGDKGTASTVVKVITGLFLTMTVIAPLASISLDGWANYAGTLRLDGEEAAAAGEKIAEEATAELIKSETEAYILDKAASVNVEVTVKVELSGEDPPVPERITIRGSVSPYARGQLENAISEDLGVAKENLIWIG